MVDKTKPGGLLNAVILFQYLFSRWSSSRPNPDTCQCAKSDDESHAGTARNESVWPDEHAAVTNGTPANPSSSAPWTAKPGWGHEPDGISFTYAAARSWPAFWSESISTTDPVPCFFPGNEHSEHAYDSAWQSDTSFSSTNDQRFLSCEFSCNGSRFSREPYSLPTSSTASHAPKFSFSST